MEPSIPVERARQRGLNGTSASFGNRTDTRLVGDGTTTVNLSPIGNLQPRTTYYFRIVGYRASANVPGETHDLYDIGRCTNDDAYSNRVGPAM